MSKDFMANQTAITFQKRALELKFYEKIISLGGFTMKT
jgi:hypothetical protein